MAYLILDVTGKVRQIERVIFVICERCSTALRLTYLYANGDSRQVRLLDAEMLPIMGETTATGLCKKCLAERGHQ